MLRGRSFDESGGDLLSRGVSPQVPSALAVFTSVFGMGTGGATALLSPECGTALAVSLLSQRRKREAESLMAWRLTQTRYNSISKEHDSIPARKSKIGNLPVL